MAKYQGSIWIEGDNLHFVDWNNNEWQVVGSLVSNGPYLPGSLWIESVDGMHYVGQSQREFLVPLDTTGMHSDAAALNGSIWVEDRWLYFIINTWKCKVHSDVAHQDGGGAATHVDVPGSSVGHGDSHTDSTHGDTHSDAPHGDFHGDGHTDVAHNDTHSDTPANHSDGHYDYATTGPSGGGPGSHADGNYNLTDDSSGHTDNQHWDTYNTYQVGPIHTDNHYDSGGPHTDTHSDSAHADDHNDQAHQDSGHVDSHVDGSHGDAHSDAAHGDSPHQDHTDATHADVAHVDNPVYIGP